MKRMFLVTIAVAQMGAAISPIAAQHHEHEEADFVIRADGPGSGAQLQIDYPSDTRPVVRVSPVDPLNFPGLFSSTTPGFVPGQGNGLDRFELVVPTEIEVEVVAKRGDVSFTVAGNGTISQPGESVVVGTHSCQIDVDPLCEGGTNDGTVCSSDSDCTGGGTCTAVCEPESSSLHRHGEFFLNLMTPDSNTFGEGEITFRVKESANTSVGYSASEPITLRISNGPLPALEPSNRAEALAFDKCRKAVAKAVVAHSKVTYQLVGKCLDAIYGAEELGRSERAALKACDVDLNSPRSMKARMAADLAKRVAFLDKVCDKDNANSFAPFTESNVRTHLGMAACRSQELAGATYNNAVAEMVGLLSACTDNVCVAGPNKGQSCAPMRCDQGSAAGLPCNGPSDCPGGNCVEADDCDVAAVEAQVVSALPCLKDAQVEH